MSAIPKRQRRLVLAARAARRVGLIVWQWRPGYVGGHSPHSLHNETFPDGTGCAFDAYGKRMGLFALWCRRHRRWFTEVIYNGRVVKVSIKHGRHVPHSYWGAETWDAHRNHVHVAIAR